jgi:hypothetical protein
MAKRLDGQLAESLIKKQFILYENRMEQKECLSS